MKVKDIIYQTPEMTEEKLLEIIDNNLGLFEKKFKYLMQRVYSLYKEKKLSQAFLDEYDLIQDKKSYLTKSERETVVGFVGYCMIQMTKGNGGNNNNTGNRSEDSVEIVSET
jgi:hypothetical protein